MNTSKTLLRVAVAKHRDAARSLERRWQLDIGMALLLEIVLRQP